MPPCWGTPLSAPARMTVRPRRRLSAGARGTGTLSLRSGVGGQGGARAAAADLHQVGAGEARGWLTGGQFARSVPRAFDREAGVGDHGQVGGAGLALAREVVAEEDRVHDVQ